MAALDVRGTVVTVTANKKSDPALDEATSEEYDAFETLARKLVKVSKVELDKKVAAAKNGR